MEYPFSGYENLIFLINLLFLSVQGVALWRAVKADQRNWFIIILFFNVFTFGIISIIYIFIFGKKRLTLSEVKNWFVRK